ncbi:hypothetical protein HDU98_000125 [Podochytrium sp. JEL0797]|nr:hypothetical protein HDU98_000125 [Podochytrium sp. JEL0797]
MDDLTMTLIDPRTATRPQLAAITADSIEADKSIRFLTKDQIMAILSQKEATLIALFAKSDCNFTKAFNPLTANVVIGKMLCDDEIHFCKADMKARAFPGINVYSEG